MEKGDVFIWKIENLSHWCADVHGHCIRSPQLSVSYCDALELYPKGVSGQREHLVVRLCNTKYSFSGDLYLYSSESSLLYKQQVQIVWKENLDLPPGPKIEDVLSIIRESGDFITVRLQIQEPRNFEQRMCTTINVLKISLQINPKWIEEMGSGETKDLFHIQSHDNLDERIWIKICSDKRNAVHFRIEQPAEIENPFAVEMCMSLTGGSDGTVDSCVRKERVFRDNLLWTFPDDSLERKEFAGKGFSLFFCLKTKHLFKSPFYMSCAYSCVSIESKSRICFPEKSPSTDVTSNKVAVLTEDYGSQIPVTSDLADDSILSKDLMCLYQNQDFSDLTLNCHNVTFPVHKNILSARSPVFKTMLSTGTSEAATSGGEVDIGDLDPSTLVLFLTYIYTGAVEELQAESALKLYYAADQYQVHSLKRECVSELCLSMSISNVCDILSLADKHSDDRLTSAAHEFIVNNFNDVLKSKEWEGFMCRDSLLAVKTLTHFAVKDLVRMHDPK